MNHIPMTCSRGNGYTGELPWPFSTWCGEEHTGLWNILLRDGGFFYALERKCR